MLSGLAIAAPFCFSVACATRGTDPALVSGRTPPAVIEARLAEADALAARGCYVCLQEAAEAYATLVQITDSPVILKKTLENDLMIAIREIELRLPDSGARENASFLRQHVPADYTLHFSALEALRKPLIPGGNTRQEFEAQRTERRALVTQLEQEWPASPMKAYFYLAMALNAGLVNELRPQLEGMVNTHEQDLSLKYRVQAFPPTFSDVVSQTLLAQEPRFGEVHFVLGQRALFGAQLVAAHRELTRAHELLPESAAVTLVLGNVELMFSRYRESLVLFDQVLAAGPDDVAQIGRAKALSYLRRFSEAIAVLDDLLQDTRNNPGEKYYWRASNRLQLGQTQVAYDDATTALKVMANAEVYRLAGMASFSLERLPEARGYFESALKMNAGECDSLRYLGQIDSVERLWTQATNRFSDAASCYTQMIARLSAEVAKKESDTSGLLAGQVAALRLDIKEAQQLQSVSAKNAVVTAKNAEGQVR
jgi:tetratricopeptide (TPR) repeat protein